MVKNFLNSLLEKVDYIKSFDEKIESLQTKVETVTEDHKSPADLLKKYKAQIEAENDIKVLEGLKAEFVKPDILGELANEFYKNLEEIYSKYSTLEKAEKLKEKYIADLKSLEIENTKMNNQALELQREYLQVARGLGFDDREVSNKLTVHWRTGGARIVAKEPIYLD